MADVSLFDLIRQNKSIMHDVYDKYACSLDRDDIVQEMLISAWQSFDRFKNNSKFSTWFYSLCRNVCMYQVRKKNTQPKIVFMPGDDLPDHPYVDDISEQIRRGRQYDLVMNSLHPIEKKYFRLYLDNFSFKQIEQITGVDENVMRVRIHRIREKLQKKFSGKQFLV